ncbi:flagellar basal-body rod protein FlgG [bacterium]|nr:flagellar basal-body rod protein FlgG [bacterium]
MLRAMWTAASGMSAQEYNIDTISNNLANVDTSGYKKVRTDFQDLLYQNIQNAGAPVSADLKVPTGVFVGHGVKIAATQRVFSQGEFQMTENPFDVVIEGEGFFQIQQPDGNIAYTRGGAFKLDSQGQMVTSNGFLVEPAITFPSGATEFTIGIDGTVTANVDGSVQEIGSLSTVRFVNPAGLRAVGRNLLQETEASGTPIEGQPSITAGFGSLLQGYLEMSNVKAVEEMVKMITAQRAYELNSKVIQTSDRMLEIANTLKR